MKKIAVSFFLLLTCFSTLIAQAGLELDYLNSISGRYMLTGQHGREYWKIMKRIAGDYPAIWSEDFLFYAGDGTGSMNEWRRLLTHDAKLRWEQGAFVSLIFHACPPTKAEPCDWYNDILGPQNGNGLTDAQWTQLITDGTTLNNNWKARLDAIYPYLKELQDANVEVLFRPLHEMNQGAFWWGGRPGANGTAKLYQITHDYLVKNKGLTNLIWVWNVQDFSNLSNDLNNYDPGSDYWDVLALDVYRSDGTGFTTAKYNAIKNKATGKPIAIAECDGLPSSGTLAQQPLWTYFIGWAELVQQKNTDATIRNIYYASNVLTLSKMVSQTGRGVNLYDDPSMICNFDDVSPFVTTSGLSISYADAPAGFPASGTMGVVQVPKNNPGNFFAIYSDQDPFDPRDYVGISFLVQAPSSFNFALKLEQSITDNNVAQIQDWYNYYYTGNGEWQEVRIGFDAIKTDLGNKLAANSSFGASNYDRMVVVPAPWNNLPAFTMNIDNVRLRKSWDDETGIPLIKNDNVINITTANGIITAKAVNGQPVALKVFSISGQEVANGMNQVQITTKGVYIVKAAAGDLNTVSKIVVY
jgi:hypothetical protein